MLTLKKGFPEESELVLCTITKIHFHSVFVTLDEYENLQGMIHISEVSPGRIRNLSDFVEEGKKIVCKVLRINSERGHIDLSLRRVSQIQKRTKIEEIKKAQKSEKILEFIASQNGLESAALFEIIKEKVYEQFSGIYDFFQAIAEDRILVSNFISDPKLADSFNEIIHTRIKPPKVEISGEISMISFESDGVEHIKSALVGVISKHEGLEIYYVGAGKYSFKIVSPDFKSAEKILKEFTAELEDEMDSNETEFSFTRTEGKKSKD